LSSIFFVIWDNRFDFILFGKTGQSTRGVPTLNRAGVLATISTTVPRQKMSVVQTFRKEQPTYGIIQLDVKVISHYGGLSKVVGGTQYFKDLPGV
jgi:hypothetical protein